MKGRTYAELFSSKPKDYLVNTTQDFLVIGTQAGRLVHAVLDDSSKTTYSNYIEVEAFRASTERSRINYRERELNFHLDNSRIMGTYLLMMCPQNKAELKALIAQYYLAESFLIVVSEKNHITHPSGHTVQTALLNASPSNLEKDREKFHTALLKLLSADNLFEPRQSKRCVML